MERNNPNESGDAADITMITAIVVLLVIIPLELSISSKLNAIVDKLYEREVQEFESRIKAEDAMRAAENAMWIQEREKRAERLRQWWCNLISWPTPRG